MFYTNIPNQDWPKVKKELLKTWETLRPDELEETGGNTLALSGLLQNRFGLQIDVIERTLDEVIWRCQCKDVDAPPVVKKQK